MKWLRALALAVLVGPSAYGQSPGTVSLPAPSTDPGAPPITATVLENAVNDDLRHKADYPASNDDLNVLDFGAGGVPVDRTGAADAAFAIRAAVNTACAGMPVKAVFIPSGRYRFDASVNIPGGCNNLTIYAQPGSVTLQTAGTNISNRMLFNATGNDYLKFYGLIFDGNSAAVPHVTGNNGLIGINGPMIAPEFDHDVFQNAVGNAIWAVGGANITATISAAIQVGDTTVTLAAPVAGLKAGAYMVAPLDPDVYLTNVSGTTLTLSRPSTQTVFANSKARFTPALVTSVDAFPGDMTIATTDTSSLAVGQTLQYSGGACLVKGTRITAVTTNVSVGIDQTPLCKVPGGSAIAAAHGISKLKITNSIFDRIGDGLFTAGSATYTTNGSTASGSKSVTFNCKSSGCKQVGLIPGNLTAASGLPLGVPPNDLVVDGPVISNNTSTYTVTLKSPVTQTIPSGTAIPFTVGAISGQGYPLWYCFGAWFANTNGLIANNYFGHAWSSPLFIQSTQGLMLSHNTYRLDYQEFQSPSVAPSACIAPAWNIDMTIDGDNCSGATGNGIEADFNLNLKMINVVSTRNGTSGLSLCAGRGVQVVGSSFTNNGQYLKFPKLQQYGSESAVGIRIGGSCTWAQPGVISDVSFTNVVSSDYQLVPTQDFGVYQWNRNATINNLTFGQMSLVGNLIAPYDPLIDPNPPIPPPGTDNRIINPCASLAQSTEGASVRPGGSLYVTDQWMTSATPNTVTYQRTATAMPGCATAITATVITQFTPAANQFNRLIQNIEASHLTDLRFGTPSAKNLIVDFCAAASTPGKYPWTVSNLLASHPRSYGGTFTVAAANTPQCYSFSVPGDTVQSLTGTPMNAALGFVIDTGSGANFQTATCNSWVDGSVLACTQGTALQTLPAGATLAVSSARLYPAATDAPWVARSDDAELALAQEYYTKSFLAGTAPAQNAGMPGAFCVQNTEAGGTPGFLWSFPQQMRIAPAITTYNPAAANEKWRDITTNADVDVVVNADGALTNNAVLISAAAPVAGIDTLCIHVVANARF